MATGTAQRSGKAIGDTSATCKGYHLCLGPLGGNMDGEISHSWALTAPELARLKDRVEAAVKEFADHEVDPDDFQD